MKKFTKLFMICAIMLGASSIAFAGMTSVATMDLGEDKTSGVVRVVIKLTDTFVSNATNNTDVGILVHQDAFTGWNDGIAISMFQSLTAEENKVVLKGYNASTWVVEDQKEVERNKQIALWLTFDAVADTHGLHYQIEGSDSIVEVYSGYANRAVNQGGLNEFGRYLTVAFNDRFSSEGCVEIIDSAVCVETVAAYTFEGGSAALKYQKEKAQVSVFPTVVNNEITLKAEKAIAQVSVLNISGQEMMTRYNVNKLNVAELSTGVYFVKATTVEGAVAIQRIIKK